jgi:hypothetical protein
MIEAFSADPPELPEHGVRTAVRLRWRVTGAQLVVIEGHARFSDGTSETAVEIDRATTFTLAAYGAAPGDVDGASCHVAAPAQAAQRDLPAGTIVLWHGDATRIPRGWRLCDGRHGTPDLVDRFVLGAGAGADAGDSGPGEPHRHAARQAVSGTSGPERHAHPRFGWGIAEAGRPAAPWRLLGTVRSLAATGEPQLGEAAHTHAIRVERELETTDAPPPRPPSYALCYIVRTDA